MLKEAQATAIYENGLKQAGVSGPTEESVRRFANELMAPWPGLKFCPVEVWPSYVYPGNYSATVKRE